MEYAIIVAGGSGQRMNTILPKQYIEINDKPIICYTIDSFENAFNDIKIIVVLPKGDLQKANWIQSKLSTKPNLQFIEGGETRFHSVKNGIQQINETENGIVFIHDAVRPFITAEFLNRCKKKAIDTGNAIPCIEVNDSLREIAGLKNKHVNRANYRIIQTPQVFKLNDIKKAYQTEYVNHFTDDASVFEHAGYTIELVEGLSENIKITKPSDLLLAEVLLKLN
jgi:2-C-methyl-D-erythritol 4-phosphate cytidylyltransferase